MSTHTDGAVPSVRPGSTARRAPSEPADPSGRTGQAGADRTGGRSSGDAAGPPRPREPNAAPPAEKADEAAEADDPAQLSAGGSGSAWVQQEIARRIAAKGARDSGRHARPDREPDGLDDVDDDGGGSAPPGPVGPAPSNGDAPPPAPEGASAAPYAGYASAAEPAFRMAGPAARTDGATGRDGTGNGTAPDGGANGTSANAGWLNGAGTNGAATEPDPGPSADDVVEEPKQWPPATGAAGLPRRVRGASWSLDRRALLGETGDGVGDIDTDTRPVPSMWTAAASRGAAVTGPDSAAGPPTTEFGGRVVTPADVEDYDYDDYDEDEDDDEDDPRGSENERTAVIWRAPGLDDEPGAAASGEPSLNPYTGARPRRFAGDTTDAPIEPESVPESEEIEEGPDGRRVRIVLSERRAVAHSVRTVVDVQDPGTVGTVLRKSLVSNQLALAVRVGGVALLSLGLLPALFAAFPELGLVSVAGLRLPWLLLGFLVYPFLLGLGWWYVRSAEQVEQEFVEDVQDR